MYICAKCQVDILKLAEFCRLDYQKWPLFTLFTLFSDLQILPNLVCSESVVW